MQPTMRSRNPVSRAPTRLCDKEGCRLHTRERKPFCPEHIMEIERPRVLSAIIEEAEVEIVKVGVEGPDAVNIDGLVVEEIMAGIVHAGTVTWRNLCKNHVNFFNRVDNSIVDHYLTRLVREGLVQMTHNRRSNKVVALTEKGLRMAQGEV